MTSGLERLQLLYEAGNKKSSPEEFFVSDPIGFPKRFREKRDIETAAFIAAMFAIGPRYAILRSLEKVFAQLGNSPYKSMLNFDYRLMLKSLDGHVQFAYKNITGLDIAQILFSIASVLQKGGALEKKMMQAGERTSHGVLTALLEELKSVDLPAGLGGALSPRARALLASPREGSACKRMNMFLRWMTRKDDIDFGFYDWLGTDKLIIPLDVNVSRAARKLKLTRRKTDNWKTASEITERLKSLDPIDPVKYDVPLFLYGIELRKGTHAF